MSGSSKTKNIRYRRQPQLFIIYITPSNVALFHKTLPLLKSLDADFSFSSIIIKSVSGKEMGRKYVPVMVNG